MSQQLHERISYRILQFFNEGVRDIQERQQRDMNFVKNKLFYSTSLLLPTSCRYHPKNKDIWNQTYIAAVSYVQNQNSLEIMLKE